MEGPTVLVVARKFNDIYYAVSSKEFKEATSRKLLIMSNLSKDEFPLLDKFDNVIYIPTPDMTWKGQLKILHQLKKIRRELRCDIIFFSNIVLLAHNYIVKLTGCKKIILLEDGYMNYRGHTFDNNKIKDLLLRFMGISKNYMMDRVIKTYLLKPEEAKYYFGRRERLKIDPEISKTYTGPDLSNKKIFIGQPVYAVFPNVSLRTYNEIVNKIIKEYKIDYYIPHFYSSQEKIDCPVLNLSEYGVTLEMISNLFKFNIFSFSSSLLFTTRLINPEINSIMILHNDIPDIQNKDIYLNSGVKINHLN